MEIILCCIHFSQTQFENCKQQIYYLNLDYMSLSGEFVWLENFDYMEHERLLVDCVFEMDEKTNTLNQNAFNEKLNAYINSEGAVFSSSGIAWRK